MNLSPDDLQLVAEGTLEGTNFGTDEMTVQFGGTQVTLKDHGASVRIGRKAFERLVARYLAAAIEAAEQSKHHVASESWWPAVKAAQEKLTRRASTR